MKLRHGLYLSIGPAEDGRLLAVCSDGTPTEGHDPVTVLDVETVSSYSEARAWFDDFQRERCARLQ